MAGVLQKYLMSPSIPMIQINGLINVNQTQKVAQALKKVNLNTAKALGVIVNSQGGQINQVDIITEKIRLFCDKNSLPFYTFAGDVAASSAYYLLVQGDKVFADSNSAIGSVGLLCAHSSLKNFVESQKMENRQWATDNKLLNKILSNYEQIQTDEKKYLLEILNVQNEKIVKVIKERRGDKLAEDFNLLDSELYLGEKALSLGLVDELKAYQQVYYEEFPKANLDFVSRPSKNKRFAKFLSNSSLEISLTDLAQPKRQNVEDLAANQLLFKGF